MYLLFGSVLQAHHGSSTESKGRRTALSPILATAFVLTSLVKPQRMLADVPCDLPAWKGTVIIDCENADQWDVEARGGSTWNLKTVPGLVGDAVQLTYELGTDPASYVQAWYRFDPPVDLSNVDLFGISLRGSPAPPNVSNKVRLMVADASGVFFGATIGDIAHINRWLINQSLPKELLTWQDGSWNEPPPIDWKRIQRLFVVVERPAKGTRLLNGDLTIDHIQAIRAADSDPPADFVPVPPDAVVAQKALKFVLGQQCPSTGLFRSWSDDPEEPGWLYDQALALLMLIRERLWEQADQLAAFLVTHQKIDGQVAHWAIGWNYCDPAIEYFDDWPGDQAWAAYALYRYAILRGSTQAREAAIRSGNSLAQRIRADGCVDTRPRGTSSTEGNFDVWMAMMQLGRIEDADRIAQCLLATLWDKNMRYWPRGEGDPVVTLNANTWIARGFALHPRINRPDMARDALWFVRRTLATRSDVKNLCDPGFLGLCGLDFQGPITLHAEGMGSYVVAGGAESQEYVETLKRVQRTDGGVPGATEDWKTDTHWLTCWKGIAPTAWLYFAVSGSPFVYAPNVLYVDANATGSYHDGSTWCNAFVYLQDALATAAKPNGVVTEIRVADGVYHPDDGENQTTGDREATFRLVNGVRVQGAYAGCGANDPDAREIDVYETVLSGDLNDDDGPNFTGNSENSFHVVTTSGTERTSVLDGFTITGGNNYAGGEFSGAGLYNNGGAPTINACTFVGNRADYCGGMYNSGGTPALTNCTFSRNLAQFNGGALCNWYSAHATIGDCAFNENTAGSGGAIYNFESNPLITKSLFYGNEAPSEGGAIYNLYSSSPTVRDCRFTSNSSQIGGAVSNTGGVPGFQRCVFADNRATEAAGAMFNVAGDAWVEDCSFYKNVAARGGQGQGGAVDNSSGRVTFRRCRFTENLAPNGGAVFNQGSVQAIFDGCTFVGNIAQRGGAIGTWEGETRISRCWLSGNIAFIAGGGCFSQGGKLAVVNSVLAGNLALTGGGGGISNVAADVSVAFSTVGGNMVMGSSEYGGGLFSLNPIRVAGSVVWGNVGGGFTQDSQLCCGAHDVDYSCVEGWSGSLGGEGNTGADPMFVNANGTDGVLGTEDDDLRLQRNSPATDAGDPALVNEGGGSDLDGHARVLCGRVDMGAYEFGIADYNCNDIVNLDDFTHWDDCSTGPGIAVYNPDCVAFDFEYDGDVDLKDFAGFQCVFTGAE